MVREKIFFLLLLLVFHVNAVEIYNDGQSSQSSWFKDWRRPLTKHPASNNQITLISTIPMLPKNVESTSTMVPVEIELKKTDSYILGPWGASKILTDLGTTPAPIQTLINIPTSIAPPPSVTTTEEPVVEIKPRRRTFNFGSPQTLSSVAEPATPNVKAWIPERIVESQPSPSVLPTTTKAENPIEIPTHHTFNLGSTYSTNVETDASKTSPSITAWIPERVVQSKLSPTPLVPSTTIKGEEPIKIPTHQTFNFGSTRSSEVETEGSKPAPKVWVVDSKPFPTPSISSTTTNAEKPIAIPKHHTFNFGSIYSFNAEKEVSEAAPSPKDWISDRAVESQPSPTTSVSLKEKESVEKTSKNFTLNFESTQPYHAITELPKGLESIVSSTSPQTIIAYKPHPNQVVAIPEDPLQNYIISTKSVENGFNATELGLAAQPAMIEKSPGVIMYEYDESKESTTLPPLEGMAVDFVTQATQQKYKCHAENGYYKVMHNCDKFVECKNNVLKLYKCSNGLHFNRDINWPSDPCDEPSKAKCNIDNIKEAEPVLKPKLKSVRKFSAILISNHIDYMCPSSNEYYRLDNDCEKFIKCEEQVASSYSCAPGLKFNSYVMWDQDPCSAEVQCKTVIVRPEPDKKFSATFIRKLPQYSCLKSDGYFSSENDCEQFVKCEGATASLYKCASGLQFNSYATWGQDPCADEKMVRCKTLVIQPPPEPKFSAEVITMHIADYACSASGYFKFTDDCDKFIKCEKFQASSYKCQSGLQFNSDATWGEDPCASESIVNCKRLEPKTLPPKLSANIVSRVVFNFTCPANNGYFNSKKECEKFIKCENEIASLYKCLPGLQFNRHTAWEEDPCASESYVGCKPVILEPKPAPKFSATVVSKFVLDFTCPKNNGYFDSKNECEKFIKCENAVASLYKCLPGLQFNRLSSWGEDPCASEDVVHCKPLIIHPPKPTFSADLIPRRMWDYSCSTPNGYFKLGTDCDKFVKCENFMASSYKCWSGLQFNPQSSWGQDPCARESVVGCKAVIILPKAEPKFSGILITSHLADYICAESNRYFAIDNNCERFVECKMFIPSLYTCPKGMQFNPRVRFGEDPCDSASIVRCEVRTTTTTTTTTTTSTTTTTTTPAPVLSYTLIMKQVFGYTCSAANGYYSVKDECGQFIECKNYIPSLYRCNSGLYFNRNVMWGADPCTLPSVARCDRTLKKPRLPVEHQDHDNIQCSERDGRFPFDTFECSKYIVCEHGRATIMSCPKGLVFNVTLKACDWLVNVPSCNPDVFHGFSCPASESEDEYGTSSDSDKVIKFKYEQSCERYIACQRGHPRLLACDKGRSFSEESQACIPSEMVPGCSN